MKFFNDPILRLFVFPLLLIFSIFWYLMSFRILSVPLFFSIFAFYFFRSLNGKRHFQFLIWLLFLGSTFLPFDISFKNIPGPPRFVPMVMGTLTVDGYKQADAGVFLAGGCVASGYEPDYVWVW
jgi:hypothetical protein